ncbi:MAG: matrixin family metalloprotease [Methylococcales bacterium]
MKFGSVSVLAVVLLLVNSSVNAVTINFNYDFDTNGFFNDSSRRSTLEAAGTFFESHITDELKAIDSSEGRFDVKFTHPGTGDEEMRTGYSVASDTLVVFAGGRGFGGHTLGVGGPGGFSAGGSDSFLDIVRTRGKTDATGSSILDFGPWGGSITFDTDSSWYFDQDTTTDESFSGNDFYSVALHELGHLLGIGTSASWNDQVKGTLFTGSASGSVNLDNDTTHWQEGLISTINGVSQETAMDPSLTVGTRKHFTDLDLAALQDVGWEVTAVPLPSALLLFGGGLAVLARRART